MDEKKNRNGNESGQPVRAAPFHGKKKYTARLYRKKSKDLSGLGKRVTDSVVQKQVMQNEEQKTKAENEKLSSELLDAGKLSADRGRNLVRRTVIRRKKYSDRSKKLKKRENDADALQRLKFENETVKNGKSNQKEQVKHFWKKKRQIRAFKESGNTIYEMETAGNVTLSCSGIKEFDDCLSAIDDMRDALRESLEKQWKTEQEKKQQMSALAHDIKTPLTIVRGNAELLSETELTTEQKNNITYVLNGTTQIQSYVKQLIDVTKSWNCSDVTYTTVRLEDFFADIKEQALGLVEIYHQKIDWKAEQSDKKVTIAYDPMFRAVMNVIQNAVEHTKENGIIYIDAKEQDGRLTFIVEDSGSGFTKEALLHGTEQFFMDDTSRNGEAHYGMGLFFAKTVAEKYGGGIKLSNSENTGGARVEIFFLSSQETS